MMLTGQSVPLPNFMDYDHESTQTMACFGKDQSCLGNIFTILLVATYAMGAVATALKHQNSSFSNVAKAQSALKWARWWATPLSCLHTPFFERRSAQGARGESFDSRRSCQNSSLQLIFVLAEFSDTGTIFLVKIIHECQEAF